MNAWTHLVGVFGFGVYASMRPYLTLDNASLSGRLASVCASAMAITFAVSVVFHIFGTVRGAGWWLRALDHTAVAANLMIANVADGSLATENFEGAPWQSMADPLIAGSSIILFFALRRVFTPPEKTRIERSECNLGFWRFTHSDLEFSALRSGTYLILSCTFLLYVPSAVQTIQGAALAWYFVTASISLVLVVLASFIDNVIVWPDKLYTEDYEAHCHSKTLGCIFTSHAWWHLAALVASILLAVGRELVIDSKLSEV
tara:strand:+ start:4188 stop:4964 length:777 start_codon:yes stop_codon:yes gene_type:complete